MEKLEEVKKVFLNKVGRQNSVHPLKNAPKEIIEAIKYYIDNVQDGKQHPFVEFNNDYSKIKIYSLHKGFTPPFKIT